MLPSSFELTSTSYFESILLTKKDLQHVLQCTSSRSSIDVSDIDYIQFYNSCPDRLSHRSTFASMATSSNPSPEYAIQHSPGSDVSESSSSEPDPWNIVPGDQLEHHPQVDGSQYGTTSNDPFNPTPSTPYYSQCNANIKQDSTGFNLIDQSFLQDIPTALSGPNLISYFGSFSSAIRPYLQHLIQLRLIPFDQRRSMDHTLDNRMQSDEYFDFAEYEDEEGALGQCADSIHALGSQHRLVERLIVCVNQIKNKFDGNQHLMTGRDRKTVKAIKDRVVQLRNDLMEISHWTRPGSLCQMDILVSHYGYEQAQDLIHQQEVKAREIAAHWQ